MTDQYSVFDITQMTEEDARQHVLDMHRSSYATATRQAQADALDDTRSWVDPNGYRLSDRLWNQQQLQRQRIDAILREGIRRGDDALTTARKLEAFVSPEYRPQRTAKGRLMRKQDPGVVTYAPYRGGQGSLVARRLVRTENSRVFGQMTEVSAKGLNLPLKWVLSNRHPEIDICDDHASNSSSGRPAGVYDVGGTPGYPAHPNCLCTLMVYDDRSVDDMAAYLRDKYGLNQPAVTQLQQEVRSVRPVPDMPTFGSDMQAYRWVRDALDAGVYPGTQSLEALTDILTGLNRSVVRFDSRLSNLKLNGTHARGANGTYARQTFNPTAPGEIGIAPGPSKTRKAALRSAAKEHAIFAEQKAGALEVVERNIARSRIDGVVRRQMIERKQVLDNTHRWSVSSTSSNPIQANAVHEGAHAVYYQKQLATRWQQLTDDLPMWEKVQVSEYGASSPHELFAEAFAAYDEGLPLPQSIIDALLEVLNGV